MKKKWIRLVGSFVIASSILSYQTSNVSAAYDDITGIKLEKEMRAMIDLDVIKGYGQGVYQPFAEITRGQFAAFLSRALKLSDGAVIPMFSDVPLTSQLASDIYKTSNAGIVKGYGNGKFGMNDPINREQMAQMIDNALSYLHIERQEAQLTFIDTANISDTFRQAVARIVNDHITSGYTSANGTTEFKPKQTATRAEAAAFISRMLQVATDFNTQAIEENRNQTTQPPVIEPAPKPEPPVAINPHQDHLDIMGTSTIPAAQMVAFVKEKNPNAQDIEEIAAAFIEVGNKYGVRGDIAFCQSIVETGWFKYEGGTAVTPDQHNYAGLGVTSKGVKGNIFANVTEGVTAQIQHLYAYASTNPIPDGEPIVDQRFEILERYGKRGTAPHWEDLSGKWASNPNYGNQILSLYNQLKNY